MTQVQIQRLRNQLLAIVRAKRFDASVRVEAAKVLLSLEG